MKKKEELECTSCDTEYVVAWKKPEEDTKSDDPLFCPFCGDEVLTKEDTDVESEYDEYEEDDEE